MQGTSQALIHETAQAAAEAAPQTVAQETPDVPVQIVPGAAKPFGGWQPTPIVAPVSYTHLDVYKRQSRMGARSRVGARSRIGARPRIDGKNTACTDYV